MHTEPVTWEDTTTFDCTYGNNVPYMGNIGGCDCERANKTVGTAMWRSLIFHQNNPISPNCCVKMTGMPNILRIVI